MRNENETLLIPSPIVDRRFNNFTNHLEKINLCFMASSVIYWKTLWLKGLRKTRLSSHDNSRCILRTQRYGQEVQASWRLLCSYVWKPCCISDAACSWRDALTQSPKHVMQRNSEDLAETRATSTVFEKLYDHTENKMLEFVFLLFSDKWLSSRTVDCKVWQ